MWPYWLMFLVPAALALQEAMRLSTGGHRAAPPARLPGSWWLAMGVLTLLVGWRHEVGGDWFNYLSNFQNAQFDSQYAEWWGNDPGYRLLEWLALESGWGMHAVNLMSAVLFSYGVVVFCRDLPRPWLALAVAVPYLVIILGMGYSRQGMALGCLMAGLVGLGRGRLLTFVVWTVLGATFHKSAVLMLPVAALAASGNRLVAAAWVGVVVAAAYVLLLEDSVAALQAGYLEAEYQSEGALIRLLMNALPAALLLWKRERFAVTLPQQRLWFWLALASLGMGGLYFASPSSTAVDRVGLYLLPLQLMVFAHLPEALGRRDGRGNGVWVGAVLAYYATVEFVWLNYATHAFAWLPYRFYPLELIF
jgi:hypothetical protein